MRINSIQQPQQKPSFKMRFDPDILIEMGTMAKLKQGHVTPEHMTLLAQLVNDFKSSDFIVSLEGLVTKAEGMPLVKIFVAHAQKPEMKALYAQQKIAGNPTESLTCALKYLKKLTDLDVFIPNAERAINIEQLRRKGQPLGTFKIG